MKKLFVFLWIVVIIIGIIFCWWYFKQPPKLFCYVISNGEKVEAYENFIWSQSNRACADYTTYENVFPENKEKIPMLIYSEDIKTVYGRFVTLKKFKLYDEEFNRIPSVENLEDLKNLSKGSYYLALEVAWRGRYQIIINTRESIGYDYVYNLIIE